MRTISNIKEGAALVPKWADSLKGFYSITIRHMTCSSESSGMYELWGIAPCRMSMNFLDEESNLSKNQMCELHIRSPRLLSLAVRSISQSRELILRAHRRTQFEETFSVGRMSSVLRFSSPSPGDEGLTSQCQKLLTSLGLIARMARFCTMHIILLGLNIGS